MRHKSPFVAAVRRKESAACAGSGPDCIIPMKAVHTLAMRSVLTPEQATKFDDTVVQSLTQDAR